MKLSDAMSTSRLDELRTIAKQHVRGATTVTMFPQELLALIELVDKYRAELLESKGRR